MTPLVTDEVFTLIVVVPLSLAVLVLVVSIIRSRRDGR